MRMFQRIAFVLATVAPLALGACTTSGTMSAVEPSTSSPVVTTDAPVQSDAQTNFGTGAVLPPEPGFDPDTIIEAP